MAVNLLLLGLAGGAGALGRFALGAWVTGWAGAAFPWATLTVNALGSLVLGVLAGALPRLAVAPTTRAALMIGLCGGFTTFSTFDFETLLLLQEARYLSAAAYSLGSVLVCVAGVLAGMGAARLWSAARRRLIFGAR